MSESVINRYEQQPNKLNTRQDKRLENSGFCLKRNPQKFFNNLSLVEQRRLLERLKQIYSQILLNYFSLEIRHDRAIARFVEEAFLVNLPMSKVIEIHLELVDDLEHKLKLENLHTIQLSDYRLTLINIIAYLGEMYRNALDEK